MSRARGRGKTAPLSFQPELRFDHKNDRSENRRARTPVQGRRYRLLHGRRPLVLAFFRTHLMLLAAMAPRLALAVTTELLRLTLPQRSRRRAGDWKSRSVDRGNRKANAAATTVTRFASHSEIAAAPDQDFGCDDLTSHSAAPPPSQAVQIPRKSASRLAFGRRARRFLERRRLYAAFGNQRRVRSPPTCSRASFEPRLLRWADGLRDDVTQTEERECCSSRHVKNSPFV